MKKNDERTLLNFIPCASQLHHELCQNVFTNNKKQFVKHSLKLSFFDFACIYPHISVAFINNNVKLL